MTETRKPKRDSKKKHQKKPEKTPPWGSLRGMFSCKLIHGEEVRKKYVKFGCSVSLCNTKNSSSVMSQTKNTTNNNKKLCSVAKSQLNETDGSLSSSFSSTSHSNSSLTATSSFSSSSSLGGSFRGVQLKRISGFYECQSSMDSTDVVSRDPSLRATFFTCSDCGEMFLKSNCLELHQAENHAVSELGPEDNSRNIIEIIFQSSWPKNQSQPCKIHQILKINNTTKTISKFESHRHQIRTKSSKLTKTYPRCTADGNELLRFHCTNLTCSLGANGSTGLCCSVAHCSVCDILREGFKVDRSGRVCTMASSGRAHESVGLVGDNKRAMLVCRVIAGRIKKENDDGGCEEFDSVNSDLDELFVFRSEAVLPCFVVVYSVPQVVQSS